MFKAITCSELLRFGTAAAESLSPSPPSCPVPFVTLRAMLGPAVCGRERTPALAWRGATLTVFRECDETFGSVGAHGVSLDASDDFAGPDLCFPDILEAAASGWRGHSSDARSATSLCGETFCGDCTRERSSRMRRSSALKRSSIALLPAFTSLFASIFLGCCSQVPTSLSGGEWTDTLASSARSDNAGCLLPLLRVGWAVDGRFDCATRAPIALSLILRGADPPTARCTVLAGLISASGRRWCGVCARIDVPDITRLTGAMHVFAPVGPSFPPHFLCCSKPKKKGKEKGQKRNENRTQSAKSIIPV